MESLHEEWRPVVGHKGEYEVSSFGRVRSLDRIIEQASRSGNLVSIQLRGRVLKQCTMKNGYQSIRFKFRTRLVHHLVLEAFIGQCPPGMEACHNNGIRGDNRLGNLRWDTLSANQLDRVKHGTSIRGEQSALAKLTERDAREILESPESGVALASKFGVSRTTICDIRTGRTWAHLQKSST